MGLHTFVCRHWLADICLRTSACRHLPADLGPRTSACGHLPADICLRTPTCGPRPADICLRTSACGHLPADLGLQTSGCGHLPADLGPKAEPQTRMRARTGSQVYVCRQAPAGVISTNSTINSTIIFDPHTLLPLPQYTCHKLEGVTVEGKLDDIKISHQLDSIGRDGFASSTLMSCPESLCKTIHQPKLSSNSFPAKRSSSPLAYTIS
jgi:hypothetical protein